MRKQFLTIFLVVLLLLSVMTPAAVAIKDDDPLYSEGDGQVDHTETPDDSIYVDPSVSVGDLRTSYDCVEMIKDLECGDHFQHEPFADVSQMSIGYGCSTAYAEKYGFSTTYITEEEAEQLLLCVLGELEQALDRFLTKYNVVLNQYQYDALISFTFNVGTSWLNPNYRLAGILINGGYSVNEFASAMGVWCHVGEEIKSGLILRRIREIKLFLYGAYNLDDTPNKFCYLKFDGNGGSCQVDIAFYLEGGIYDPLYDAEHKDGYYFLGWYTDAGERITSATVVKEELSVHAEWGTEPPAVEAADVFSDLTTDKWYYDFVNDLYNAGVINGYEDGTFRASRKVTTGEALKMILLAAGYPEPEMVTKHWASGYHYLALDYGFIIRGDITDLDVPISRAMVAKVTANALGLSRTGSDQPFNDTTNDYALILYDHNIITGYEDGSFKPNGMLTRAELAAIVWRIENYF